MAVDHLSAANLVVEADSWSPMDTFPRDGTVVEVLDARGAIYKAQWHSERVLTAHLNAAEPRAWRALE